MAVRGNASDPVVMKSGRRMVCQSRAVLRPLLLHGCDANIRLAWQWLLERSSAVDQASVSRIMIDK